MMDGVDNGNPQMACLSHWRFATTIRQDLWVPALRRASLTKRESINQDSANWESTNQESADWESAIVLSTNSKGIVQKSNDGGYLRALFGFSLHGVSQ